MPALAFYQPDIPQNVGAAMRLCACLDVPMHIIEPTTFAWKEAEFRRAGMDYTSMVKLIKHTSWDAFLKNKGSARTILVETDGATPLWDFEFQLGDILIMGSESDGVAKQVYDQVDATIHIPMKPGLRSMNVVTAASFVLSEALRQTQTR